MIHEPGVRTLIYAERATCSWDGCLARTFTPSGELDIHGQPVIRYCDEHAVAFYAILNAPLESIGIGTRNGGRGKGGKSGPADPEAKRRRGEAMAYITSYTGTWGLILDIRSDRRWGTAHMRLSDRQVDVILSARDRDLARAAEVEIASDLYHADEYQSMLARFVAERQAAVTAPDLGGPGWQATDAGKRALDGLRQPVAADGMYRRNGVTYRVQTAIHGSGKRYAKVLDEDARRFVYEPGAITRLSAEDRMSIEDAEAFGKLYGWCCVCGATLTDEKSIARGIGPVCGGRI